MNWPTLFVYTVLAFNLATTMAYAGRKPPRIQFVHQPPTAAAENAPFSLNVKITGPLKVDQARCYFRYKRDANPVYVIPLSRVADIYHFLLPAPEQGIQSVQYCYLVQNSKQQVVRSPWYKVRVSLGASEPFLPAERSEVMTDLFLPDDPYRSGGGTSAAVNQEPELLWLGMVAGIYRPEDFPGVAVATGLFGGFKLDAAARPRAVNGFFPLHLPGEQPVRPLLAPGQSVPELSVKDRNKDSPTFAGPLLHGSDWSGKYYIWPFGEDLKGITASIVQQTYSSVTDFIEITTSLHGRGHKLTGSMSHTGLVELKDSYDGEDWTTHIKPAELSTSSHFHIEDYVDNPPDRDTHVIDLDRTPPSDPEPEVSLLRGVLQLLL